MGLESINTAQTYMTDLALMTDDSHLRPVGQAFSYPFENWRS